MFVPPKRTTQLNLISAADTLLQAIIAMTLLILFSPSIACVLSSSLSSSCLQCTSQPGNIWCSLEEKCVSKIEDCMTSPVNSPPNRYDEFQNTYGMNVLWFLRNYTTRVGRNETFHNDDHDDDDNAHPGEVLLPWYSQIPTHCVNGIVDHASKCSSLNVVIARNYSHSTRNLIEPIPIQPQLFITNLEHIYNHSKNPQFYVGAFYPDQNYLTQQGYLFSYEFHVQRKSIYIMKKGFMCFTDLSVAATPNYRHRLGFGVLMVDGLNGTFATRNTSFQCAFVTSKKSIYVEPVYFYTFMNFHFLVSIPILMCGLTLACFQVVYCKDKYKISENLLDADIRVLDDDNFDEQWKLTHSKDGFRHYFQNSLDLWGNNNPQDENPSNIWCRLRKYLKLFLQHIYDVFPSLFLFASDSDIVKQCGTDVYYYLWFQKYVMLFVAICGIMSMVLLLPIYLTSKHYDYSFKDFAGSTIAAIDVHKSWWTLLFYILNGLIPILGLLLMLRLRKLARHMIKGNSNFGSLYTVMISNIDKNLKDKEKLLSELREFFGQDTIADCHICLDFEKITLLEKKLAKFQRRLGKAAEQESRKTVQSLLLNLYIQLFYRKQSYVHYCEENIQQIEKQLLELKREENIVGTGYGFVTFFSMTTTKKVCDEYVTDFMGFMISKKYISNSFSKMVNFFKLRLNIVTSELNTSDSNRDKKRMEYNFAPACEASDVLFENLNISTSKRASRVFVSNVILFIVLLVIYTVLILNSSIPWYATQNKSDIYDYAELLKTPTDFTFKLLLAFFELSPEIISLINELFKPLVEKLVKWEKHKTNIHKRKTILRRTTYFFVLSTIVFPYGWTYYKSVWRIFNSLPPFNNEIYFFNFIGIELIILTIVLATTSKGLEIIVNTISSVRDYFKTGEWHRPIFDYEAEYSMKITMLMMCLLYGTCIPLIYIVAFLYFMLTFFIDKYLIMYWYERSIESDGKILNTVVENIGICFLFFPFSIIVLLPVLLKRKMTPLLGIPKVLIIIIGLYLMTRKTIEKERDAIIIALNERCCERNKSAEQDPTTYNVTTDSCELLDVEDGTMNKSSDQGAMGHGHDEIHKKDHDLKYSTIPLVDDCRNENSESQPIPAMDDEDFVILTQADWFEHSLQNATTSRQKKEFESFQEFINGKEVRVKEEDLQLDVPRLARQYRHPYLRKILRDRFSQQ
ncbi:hypothetical protein C9374_006812 [Naegleria lovaniensis]|uniref:Uncharacterized protein n=1 Tax=Naegleria lovaniensis TaxID=51637 RepID=A0AA88H5U5_NAELO|nr:uncharacterized protein C9374_006812 [Naegleria lovaniensis]KAG2393281.1 hypothetical protein C9374_006812 [Naegleria lovaniensis]